MKKLLCAVAAALSTFISVNANAQGIPVLMYHEIVADKAGIAPSETVVTVSSFNAQMKWLASHNYYTISMSELVTYMKTGKVRTVKRKKPIVLTFDDGWYNQQNALPGLNRQGFKGVFNVLGAIPGYDPAYMNWNAIKNLSTSGHEIASHTMTHPYHMTADMYGYEIIQSKNTIEQMVGKPVTTIAWPNGWFTNEMLNTAYSIGYTGSQSIDDNWCQLSGESLEGTDQCMWLTGNAPLQNPWHIKRIFIDGRCTAPEIGQWVIQGHSSPCAFTDVPGVQVTLRATPTLTVQQKSTINTTDDEAKPRGPRDRIDHSNTGEDIDDLDTKNHRKPR